MSTTCGWGYSLIQVFESLIIQYVIPVTGCATCPLPVGGVIVLYRCLNL